jgi:uncharacterized protein YggE
LIGGFLEMKTVVLFLYLLVAFSANTFTQDLDKTPQIAVTGNTEVLVEPDESHIWLDVMKLNKDLELAKKQDDETIVTP